MAVVRESQHNIGWAVRALEAAYFQEQAGKRSPGMDMMAMKTA